MQYDSETDAPPREIRHHLPLLPLKEIVVFPHMIIPVFISEDICIQAVEAALRQERKIFLSAFKVASGNAEPEDEALKCTLNPPFDVYDVGTVCSIMRTRKLPDGRMKVLVQGLNKACVESLKVSDAYPIVTVTESMQEELLSSSTSVEAVTRSVRESLERVASLGKVLSPDILMILEDVKDPGKLADLVGSNLGLGVEDSQRILAIENPLDRLSAVHSLLSREIEVFQMQLKIQNQAKEEIGKIHKEHYLREQIRALKSELGDSDSRDEIEALWQQSTSLPLSTLAKEEVQRQLKRLERMHLDSGEASLVRTHIETILDLPWGKLSPDELDIKKVARALENDHFGLRVVKDRIIEYLAVKKLNPCAKSPILCFSGPPGVGKTSLGRSIARAIGRQFERISLGGVRDEADIRGHRRTYVGAFAGRIISALRTAKTLNPLIMLDEIDKLGHDYRGDPAAALLETLDPEQNHQFTDHYIGIPFDLSKVLFIANANDIGSIPAALRDRLEIIEISGYSEQEKCQIVNDFIVPKHLKETGLTTQKVSLSKSAITQVIRGYTRESGLRGIEKKIASIFRKIARKVAEEVPQGLPKGFKISPSGIHKYLGAPPYSMSFPFATSVGIALGMAYTQSGGELLAIEANLVPSGKGLVLTGQLGSIMQESAQTALSFIKAHHAALGVDPQVFIDKDLHIHFPHGAVPKDGPSAGVAIVTSILSILRAQAPRKSTCMTGEISLHGRVLAVGGLKEKLLAAQREGMKVVILPEQNRQNVKELRGSITRTLTLHFIDTYLDAIPLLFEDLGNTTTPVRDIEYRSPAPVGL